MKERKIDLKVIEGFGDNREHSDQIKTSYSEMHNFFSLYFRICPWEKIKKNAIMFDLECGSGRWAKLVATKVEQLHCIYPSRALDVAKKNIFDFDNCIFHQQTVENLNLDDNSLFCFSDRKGWG